LYESTPLDEAGYDLHSPKEYTTLELVVSLHYFTALQIKV